MKMYVSSASRTSIRPTNGNTRTLVGFFLAAFALTWTALGLAVLGGRGIIPLHVPAALMISIGTLGPVLAAIGATAADGGKADVRALLAQLRGWRAKPIWYAAALLGPALGMFLGYLLSLALGGPLLPVPPASAWLAPPILVIALILPSLGEEVGWRAYALPRLQERVGALWASLILGTVWACWHIPIWFIPGGGFEQQPFAAFVLMTVAYATLFTWLYNSSGRRLPLVILAHAAINAYFSPWGTALTMIPPAARGIAPQIPISLAFALLALLVVLLCKPRTLTREEG